MTAHDNTHSAPQAQDDALTNWFTHHPPADGRAVQAYQEIRNGGRELAELITGECPPSPERDTAVKKIREAVMWANASIACTPATT